MADAASILDDAPRGPTTVGMHIGVMGAGQLGRMLALAGIPLGMRFTFFSEVASVPAALVGDVIVAGYDDVDALMEFANAVDVVTYEFENVSTEAVRAIARIRPVWPPLDALKVTQDRALEKQAFESLGIPTAAYSLVQSLDELRSAAATVGMPGILKTCRFGYDGKGQARINTAADVDEAWKSLGGVPLIYEGLVRFDRELSVLAVRTLAGASACYPLVENHHRDGILRRSLAPPTNLADSKRREAERFAISLVDSFGYVGVFALELFDTPDGLIANEMAPRVHNSGHWTVEGAETSQFENHVRAISGLPLGDCSAVGYSAMFNVIGAHPDIARVLAVPDVHVHLYGKAERPGRKLGHITIRSRTPDELLARVAALSRIPSVV